MVADQTPILVHNDPCRTLPSTLKSKFAVLGRRPDINVARSFSGYEVLSLRDWSIDRNDDWIAGIIAKRQPVYLPSPINDDSLYDPTTGFDQTIYARELNQLLKVGYDFSDMGTGYEDYMVPPPR